MAENSNNLSEYRLMWMEVMFDLPVGTPKERKMATQFRNFLLDEGFEMVQFSVYCRFCGTREQAEPYIKRIKENAPSTGKISILFFTDKQFSDIINIHGGLTSNHPEKPEELIVF
jgi:CRISPR-associated protein Cas2